MASLPSPSQPGAKSRRLENLFQYLPSYTEEALVHHNPLDTTGYEPAKARLSSDPILTALAQLCAFRTSTERAFISLIDDQHQIVVAEATRSISLTSEKRHDDGDGLCIGSTVLDLTSGICGSTMDAFISDYSRSTFIDDGNAWADRSCYWIRDLSLTSQFSTRPYVQGFPYMRFYAEVPIVSPSGFVIGSIAIVDPSPRSSLSQHDLNALEEIASALMRHLTLLRSEKSHQLTAKKLSNLDHFVSSGEAAAENLRPTPMTLGRRDDPDIKKASQPSNGAGGETSGINLSPPSRDTFRDALSVAREASQEDHIRDATRVNYKASESKDSAPRTSSNPSASADSTMPWPTDLQDILSVAAQRLLNSMDLDFVSFYAANSHQQRSEGESQAEPGVDTNLLASVASDRMAGPAECLPSTLVQQLHDLYPEGCRLNFVPDRPFSTQHVESSVSHLEGPGGQHAGREMVKLAIAGLYPNLRSAIFLPLWSESRQSLVANAFAGTVVPRRVLEEDDLSYFALFRSCILTRITKMDLILHDKAKINFVSSISHELRSPIHGILGNVELAYDVDMASPHLDCLHAIEQCSQTLLDTVDHILDYAKISSSGVFTTTRNENLSDRQEQRFGSGTIFHLDSVVEETIATAVAGYRHMWKPKSSLDQRNRGGYGLAVHGASAPWISETAQGPSVAVCFDTVGASGWQVDSHVNIWRRLVLNLVGNALKYTPNGLISVSLALESRKPQHQSTPSPEKEAVLIVKDTGKGMGPNFLKYHLFRPFQQENGLSSGTGLGLSIVKKLIEDLGGAIYVQSEVGMGSEFKLTVPVITFTEADTEQQHSQLGYTIRFIGFDESPQLPTQDNSRADSERMNTLKGLVEKCLATSYDVHHQGKVDATGIATLTVYTASQFVAERDRRTGADEHEILPRLILSDSLDDQYLSFKTTSPLEEYVAQPVTNHRVTAAIGRLLGRASKAQQPPSPRKELSAAAEVMETLYPSVPASNNDEKHPCTASSPSSESGTSADKVSPTPTLNLSVPPNHQIYLDSEKLTFLLVDDNEVNLRLLERQISKLGCNYMSACDGQQAVAIFKAVPCTFAAIFMDLSMPVMDGFNASRSIREIERLDGRDPMTVIVALTGLSDANTRQQAMQCGVNVFMTKPVSMNKVKEFLENDIVDRASRQGDLKPQKLDTEFSEPSYV